LPFDPALCVQPKNSIIIMISTKAFYFVLAVALCSATIVVADASSSSRVLQDSCQTICQGAAMNGGDKLLPIFTGDAQTCDAVEALLTSQDSTACTVVSGYLQFLDLAAYCECDGSGLPGVCAAPCTVDQGAADVDFQVPLLNATFTCSQAEIFAAYLTSDFACTGYTGTCRSQPSYATAGARHGENEWLPVLSFRSPPSLFFSRIALLHKPCSTMFAARLRPERPPPAPRTYQTSHERQETIR
jgi:hypothetical protein